MTLPVVFSRLIRFVHWGIALAIILNLFIFDEGELVHRLLGYSAVLLVAVRLVHEFVRKTHRQFPNKIAFITYLLIWGCIISLGISGFLLGTDRFWGDELVEKIHELLANFIKGLAILHLLGIFIDSIKNNRRTWLNMVNGKNN